MKLVIKCTLGAAVGMATCLFISGPAVYLLAGIFDLAIGFFL
jgi:hypothetical protein